ncbi:MAG: hypothetical protein HYW37_01815 [Candidatus Colwellbacteria bacterium]|nr:hypothetical protein [Candidatus Colwellbacteria bacterium]
MTTEVRPSALALPRDDTLLDDELGDGDEEEKENEDDLLEEEEDSASEDEGL